VETAAPALELGAHVGEEPFLTKQYSYRYKPWRPTFAPGRIPALPSELIENRASVILKANSLSRFALGARPFGLGANDRIPAIAWNPTWEIVSADWVTWGSACNSQREEIISGYKSGSVSPETLQEQNASAAKTKVRKILRDLMWFNSWLWPDLTADIARQGHRLPRNVGAATRPWALRLRIVPLRSAARHSEASHQGSTRRHAETVPGIDKTEASYDKVQRQVLKLRREGRLDYEHIAGNA
jgi:hypothetical protein